MSMDLVIKHCSPTLAGIKTGNLFSCPYVSRAQVIQDVRRMNNILVPKGIRVIPLRYRENSVLVYVFRPSGLAQDLSVTEAKEILLAAGYQHETPDQCVMELIRRLNRQEEFPHEIGLFLSYPPEDVSGFIRNKGQRCKCCGLWKVYGDETAAKAQFERFRKCTEIYCKQWAMGVCMEDLTVAG